MSTGRDSGKSFAVFELWLNVLTIQPSLYSYCQLETMSTLLSVAGQTTKIVGVASKE